MATDSSPPRNDDRPPHDSIVLEKDSEAFSPSTTPSSRIASREDISNMDNATEGENAGKNAGQEPATVPGAQEEQKPQRSKLKIALIMSSLCMAVLLVAMGT